MPVLRVRCLVFTPAAGFVGQATISYEISDGTDSTIGEAVVNVGPTPGSVDGLVTSEVMGIGYTDAQGDEIDGLDGLDDIIFGNAGDDSIDAGLGDDFVSGGQDNDTIYGSDGNDTIEGNDVIVGGLGEDSQSGGLGSDTFYIGVDEGDSDIVVGGEDAGNSDIDVLDLSGADVDYISYVGGTPASEAGVVYFNNGTKMEFSEIEKVIPCFTPGTLIATPQGQRPVETLKVGDKVMTRDNGLQAIAWVGQKKMYRRDLIERPKMKPVLVKAGSLGDGLPEQDMQLSPNHKVLINKPQAQMLFGDAEVLVAAKHLIGQPGIEQIDVAQTTYIHFMCENHEVILSDGTWSESFHPGDYSMNGIDDSSRDEIYSLFPELRTPAGLESYQLARPELKKFEALLLLN